jgi:FMN phosphatase YigB (HAD superfamily)
VRTTHAVISSDLAKVLEDHKGRWVAIFGDDLVAVGDSAPEVIEQARNAGITDPTVFRVPTHPERLNFL